MPKENLQSTTHKLFTSRAGQSLIEVMIALAIGSLLISAASFGIAFILRSSTTNQKLQSASGLTRDLVERVRSVSSADWQNVYVLTKGTSTAYFMNASGTTLFILEGKEGVLGDDVSSGLVGHWKFDEATSTTATSTYDASGNNNHGTLMSGVLRASSTCQISHCLGFDGTNDYVSVGAPSSLSNLTAMTVSAWVKPNTDQTNIFVSKHDNSITSTGEDFLLYMPSGGDVLRVITNTTTREIVTANSIVLDDGNWHFVAATYDGTNVLLYHNAVQVAAGSTSGTLGGTTDVRIGHESGLGAAYYMNGLIDEPRIYNRALSSDEINRLYGSTIFTRYLNVENVSRDSSGDIVTSGGNDDPSTQKITTYVEWPGVESAVGQVKIVDYITRWSNRVFNQTDWSGGSGEEGPVTDPGSKYSSSTGVSSQVGSIKIEGL